MDDTGRSSRSTCGHAERAWGGADGRARGERKEADREWLEIVSSGQGKGRRGCPMNGPIFLLLLVPQVQRRVNQI